MKQTDFTRGSIARSLLAFTVPLMLGNVLQQCYNIADTLIVGRFLGKEALAAVGSAYTLMIFLTSVLTGLSMGSGAFLSVALGKNNTDELKTGNFMSLSIISAFTALMVVFVYIFINPLLRLLQTPAEVVFPLKSYLLVIFSGIPATFIYNYYASSLRAVGNSTVPLVFLAVSALMNIALDIVFVAVFNWGIKGAAAATVASQYACALGILIFTLKNAPILRLDKAHSKFEKSFFKPIFSLAFLTSLQQSIMNFGILLVQGRVNFFGTEVMAAFAAAVKIDTLAYSPVQDFGNAFSTFVAQNHGAKQYARIKSGIKTSAISVLAFCLFVSTAVFIFARPLTAVFTSDKNVINIGASYLRIEGLFYCLIGFLFMFYGYFRAVQKPAVSVVLTVASLGTRVLLAYTLSAIPSLGVTGIWLSIPIGWAFADALGILLLKKNLRLGEK